MCGREDNRFTKRTPYWKITDIKTSMRRPFGWCRWCNESMFLEHYIEQENFRHITKSNGTVLQRHFSCGDAEWWRNDGYWKKIDAHEKYEKKKNQCFVEREWKGKKWYCHDQYHDTFISTITMKTIKPGHLPWPRCTPLSTLSQPYVFQPLSGRGNQYFNFSSLSPVNSITAFIHLHLTLMLPHFPVLNYLYLHYWYFNSDGFLPPYSFPQLSNYTIQELIHIFMLSPLSLVISKTLVPVLSKLVVLQCLFVYPCPWSTLKLHFLGWVSSCLRSERFKRDFSRHPFTLASYSLHSIFMETAISGLKVLFILSTEEKIC